MRTKVRTTMVKGMIVVISQGRVSVISLKMVIIEFKNITFHPGKGISYS